MKVDGGVLGKLIDQVVKEIMDKVENKFNIADKRMERIENNIREIKESLKKLESKLR